MNGQWIQEYEENHALYQETAKATKLRLQGLLQQSNFHVHMIDARVKTRCSLENKLMQHAEKYRRLADVTDLCGIRIITYYADEIDAIAARIRRCFSIDEENCVDKRALLDADSFGYLSLHLILEIPCQSNGKIGCCKVEVQIRSVLQHAWAAVEHELAYKNQQAKSYELRRSFSRLAGMLESADMEFLRIRNLATATEPVKARRFSFVSWRVGGAWSRMTPVRWGRAQRSFSLGTACAVWASAVFFMLATVYCTSKAVALAAQLSFLLRNV